jgi:ABC-type nitrate/sulfonate/bicarbonate transport system substrate-binding protein
MESSDPHPLESTMKQLFTLTALVLAAAASQAQETKVAIGISGWTGFAPLTLARRRASSGSTGWT